LQATGLTPLGIKASCDSAPRLMLAVGRAAPDTFASRISSMNLPLILQFVGTAIMIIGIAFGVQNIRQYQISRKRESAIMMLNSFQTSEFVRGLLYIFDLPQNVSKEVVDKLPADQFMAIYMVLGTWERLVVLVYRREIDLDLVDDAFSGPIVQSWQRLGKYIQEFRASIQRDTAFEWFQWLAERMMERERATPPIPAYVAHRDWISKR